MMNIAIGLAALLLGGTSATPLPTPTPTHSLGKFRYTSPAAFHVIEESADPEPHFAAAVGDCTLFAALKANPIAVVVASVAPEHLLWARIHQASVTNDARLGRSLSSTITTERLAPGRARVQYQLSHPHPEDASQTMVSDIIELVEVQGEGILTVKLECPRGIASIADPEVRQEFLDAVSIADAVDVVRTGQEVFQARGAHVRAPAGTRFVTTLEGFIPRLDRPDLQMAHSSILFGVLGRSSEDAVAVLVSVADSPIGGASLHYVMRRAADRFREAMTRDTQKLVGSVFGTPKCVEHWDSGSDSDSVQGVSRTMFRDRWTIPGNDRSIVYSTEMHVIRDYRGITVKGVGLSREQVDAAVVSVVDSLEVETAGDRGAPIAGLLLVISVGLLVLARRRQAATAPAVTSAGTESPAAYEANLVASVHLAAEIAARTPPRRADETAGERPRQAVAGDAKKEEKPARRWINALFSLFAIVYMATQLESCGQTRTPWIAPPERRAPSECGPRAPKWENQPGQTMSELEVRNT